MTDRTLRYRVPRQMLAALKAVLPELEDELRSVVECHSQLRTGADGRLEVVPDTVEEDVQPIVARLTALRDQVKDAIAAAEGRAG